MGPVEVGHPGRDPGTGASSGADGEIDYVQIIAFEGDKATRTEVYTDVQTARAAAGLDPA